MRPRKHMLMALCLLLEISLLACGRGTTPATTETHTDKPSIEWTDSDISETVPSTTEFEPTTTENDWQTTIPPVTETDPPTTEPETDPPMTETTAPPETDPPPPPPYYYVDGYEYRIDITPYRSYLDPANAEDYLILANRLHPLADGYVPQDLVRIDSSRSLRRAAYYAWKAMSQEMAALGVLDTWAQSTYRSQELQEYLYQKYLEEERLLHPTYTEAQLVALVDSYSARPGTSDHQTGLAIDFSPISSRFESYRAYAYLQENAYKFGFILRFPKGRTDVTGYMFESWHWRFVGRTAATEIHERNLTLEEYLEERYGGILNPIPPETDPPETDPPETDPPETDPPETDPPETDPPETDPPETDPPETDPPETDPPETDPPETDPPETDPPETDPPETDPPETDPPETDPPETDPPETDPPETDPPETVLPETDSLETDSLTSDFFETEPAVSEC